MNFPTNSTPREAIWKGFIAYGLCSFWGLRWLLRGLQGDTLDAAGHELASLKSFPSFSNRT